MQKNIEDIIDDNIQLKPYQKYILNQCLNKEKIYIVYPSKIGYTYAYTYAKAFELIIKKLI